MQPTTQVYSSGSSYKNKLILLIVLFFVARLFFAFNSELGNDESYYWLYSQHLQWNYFDHPPMVALWIRFFTVDLWLQQVGFLRLGSVVGCALSTLFIYKTASLIHSEKAGWFAACLYNASFYTGITAGIYIMPDSPQMVFWTLSLWIIARICADENKWSNWIFFGIASGLCIMSKIHGVFLWVGLGSFVLFIKPKWFLKPQLYVALLLTFVIASPILIWNLQNNFITYRYHSKRIIPHVLNSYSFSRELISQLFFNNPINVALILVALFTWRKTKALQVKPLVIYNLAGLPLILILLFISLFRNTLPHWSGPAYVSLLPLAAIRLAEVNSSSFPKILKWSLGIFIVVLAGWMLAVQFYPGTVGSKNKEDLGKYDLTLDMYGWQEAGRQFDIFYKNEIAIKQVSDSTPLVCFYWWGAHVEYYFCWPVHAQMIGLGHVVDIHHYQWMNQLRKNKVNMENAYCIVPSDENNKMPEEYSQFYKKAELATVIEIFRDNKPAHNFYVYKLSGWKAVLN